jgi:hypothetical protein
MSFTSHRGRFRNWLPEGLRMLYPMQCDQTQPPDRNPHYLIVVNCESILK